MNDILYYPYIDIPRTEWTYRSLFYYDTIASIVPQEYIWEPERHYDPFMWHLVKEGLVVPIDPNQVLERPWEIERPFIEFVHSEEFLLEQRRQSFRNNRSERMHKDKFVGSKIHAQKFAYSLYDALDQIGLAKRHDGTWFDVEETTAGYLMEYLAAIISEKSGRRAATDKMPPDRFIDRPQSDFTQRRRIILDQLIPFPREIDFGKLLDFKLAFPELLSAFRTEVEGIVLDPNLEKGSDLFNNRVERLIQRKEELSTRMNESKIKDLIWGTACGIIGGVMSVASTGSLWGGIGALPGFANAVHSALKIEQPEKVHDQSGMKYLALIDKRLRFSKPR